MSALLISVLLLSCAGKYNLGYKQTLKAIRTGKAKAVLVSNNIPALQRTTIAYYAMLGKVILHSFSGNNVDMGTAMGKLYRVSAMTILDAGDSDILETLSK